MPSNDKSSFHETKLEKDVAESTRQLANARIAFEHAQRKQRQAKLMMDNMKQGLPGKMYKLIGQWKRTGRLALKYATGRRNPGEIFQPQARRNKAKQRIKKLKYKLYELGFEEKAYKEIMTECEKSDNAYTRRLAAWELALWHANQYTTDDARVCLYYLDITDRNGNNQDTIRKSAILRAEGLASLGDKQKAKSTLAKVMASQTHADLYLATSNLASTTEEKLDWINKALQLYGIQSIKLKNRKAGSLYDSLDTEKQPMSSSELPKVTVIVPVYNAANTIETTLQSLLTQSWENLEIIIADDCSTDDTTRIATDYAAGDSRIHIIHNQQNSGPYVARNEALKIATGEFVTINDADDWAHPDKIFVQASHLMKHSEVVANTSQQARATESLTFHRRGKPGEYVFANLSSLMFRRKTVTEKLGFWDSVRFGADGEFKKRLTIIFGKEAIVDLETGPYAFQRQTGASLTGNQTFGYHGFFMGARKAYKESYSYYHQMNQQALYYSFPQKVRPFSVPEPMLPNRKSNRHFDVIIASEFRLTGGTNMSNIEEIKAQKQFGLTTGLVQMNRYDLTSAKDMNPKVQEMIDGDNVQLLVYGECVTCDVLIIRHPPVLQTWQKYIPDIQAKTVKVIINQPPKREYSDNGVTLYHLKDCATNVRKYFGHKGKWYPIGPQIRQTLMKRHAEELKAVNLSSEDWVNIIDVSEWQRPQRKHENSNIIIGRHGRDQYVKWPENKYVLQQIYPSDTRFQIYVLGGAKTAENVLGQLPANWQVFEFGQMHPKIFLSQLDVFVYYTHSNWVEAFGRVIFEAMAVGVPVILPPIYQSLFQEAAIYAEPSGVQETIEHLVAHKNIYDKQVQLARNYVEEHFGYSMHAARLADAIVSFNPDDWGGKENVGK